MITKSPNSVSVPFRLDALSKSKLDFIKAHCQDIRPSGSMILRRALAHYLSHFESHLADHEDFQLELIRLKACASGDLVPWKTQPDFTSCPGKKFSEWTGSYYKYRLDGMLGSSPFERQAKEKHREPNH